MWITLRESFERLLDWLRSGAKEKREARTRARFWEALREGEREAESESEPKG